MNMELEVFQHELCMKILSPIQAVNLLGRPGNSRWLHSWILPNGFITYLTDLSIGSGAVQPPDKQ